MNSTKLRKIILEELSASRSNRAYRRPRKLGLVDFLGESSQNLLELDDGVIVSTGRSIFEQDLGGNDFDATIAGERAELDAGGDAPPHHSPPDSNDASTEDDHDEELRKSAEAAAADAKAREEEVGARTDPASPTAAPAAPAADPVTDQKSQGGEDSNGEEAVETPDDPDTGAGSQDSDGAEPAEKSPAETSSNDDHDTVNSAVVSYIDSVSEKPAAPVSESKSRSLNLSLIDALYRD